MPMVGRMSEGLESDDASDMQMSQSEIDQINEDAELDADGAQPDDMDTSADAPDEDDVAEDKDIEIEEDDLPDDNSDLEALSSPPPDEDDMAPVQQPRLKIKLKLPAHSTSGLHSRIPSTPEEVEETSTRRQSSRDEDIESEDSEDGAESTRSTSVATTGTAGRALTARQAVLANVVDSSHVSLAELPNPRKKKQLTEIEIALKREETARKRRNLTEKKLEDEKTETINRLLRKQSRAKGKRNALSTADDRPTQQVASNEADPEDVPEIEAPERIMPTMYRWISTSRGVDTQGGKPADSGEGRRMMMSFSVPVTALPHTEEMPADKAGSGRRDQASPQCDVQGCTERRKYRLVKSWDKGACGMAHLKLLETSAA